jgi:hypothetical protein
MREQIQRHAQRQTPQAQQAFLRCVVIPAAGPFGRFKERVVGVKALGNVVWLVWEEYATESGQNQQLDLSQVC